jgi:hypothetical protein
VWGGERVSELPSNADGPPSLATRKEFHLGASAVDLLRRGFLVKKSKFVTVRNEILSQSQFVQLLTD